MYKLLVLLLYIIIIILLNLFYVCTCTYTYIRTRIKEKYIHSNTHIIVFIKSRSLCLIHTEYSVYVCMYTYMICIIVCTYT